jgi:hypothetical protein
LASISTFIVLHIPGVIFQACTDMVLTKESIKKLKTFPEFPNTGGLNVILQATRFIWEKSYSRKQATKSKR